MRNSAIAIIWSAIAAVSAWPALAQGLPSHFELEVAYCAGAHMAVLASEKRSYAKACSSSAPAGSRLAVVCGGLRRQMRHLRDRVARLTGYLSLATPDQGSSLNTMLALAQGKRDVSALNPGDPNPEIERRVHHCLAVLAALPF